jgi:hypothetical protein
VVRRLTLTQIGGGSIPSTSGAVLLAKKKILVDKLESGKTRCLKEI